MIKTELNRKECEFSPHNFDLHFLGGKNFSEEGKIESCSMGDVGDAD